MLILADEHPEASFPHPKGPVPMAIAAKAAKYVWDQLPEKLEGKRKVEKLLMLEHHPAHSHPLPADHSLSQNRQTEIVRHKMEREMHRRIKMHEKTVRAAERRAMRAMKRASEAAAHARHSIVVQYRGGAPAAASNRHHQQLQRYLGSSSSSGGKPAASSTALVSVSSSSHHGGGGSGGSGGSRLSSTFVQSIASSIAQIGKVDDSKSKTSVFASLGAFGGGKTLAGSAARLAENKRRGLAAIAQEAIQLALGTAAAAASTAAAAAPKKRGRKPKGESAPKRVKAMSAPRKEGKKKKSAAGKKKKSLKAKKAKAAAKKTKAKAKAKAKTNLKKRAPRPVVVVLEEKKQKKGGKGGKKKKAVLAPVSFVSAHTRSHSKK
jgi:hypothetical protein